jgi:hypothetical protein
MIKLSSVWSPCNQGASKFCFCVIWDVANIHHNVFAANNMLAASTLEFTIYLIIKSPQDNDISQVDDGENGGNVREDTDSADEDVLQDVL